MQLLAGVPRFMEHPLVAPLIALASAGAAKTGHGAWGLGVLLGFVSLYFGAAVTAAANRSLARWVGRLRRYETTRAAH
ncbi:MAG: hypothetical protein HYX37_15455 [Rhizobiales bacterium]|nr:hypothetical protein [Hyphomicrobiales bacterium]